MKLPGSAFALLTASALGNPIALGDWAYISSERLKIEITGHSAAIEGAFTFRSTSGTGRFDVSSTGDIRIPLWLPDRRNADKETARLIALCPPGSRQQVEGPLAHALQAVIGPKIRVSGKDLAIRTVSMMDPAGSRSRNFTDPALQRKGYCCLMLDVSVPSSLISRGQTVTVSYRQPLQSSGRQSEFHYVPFFYGMPQKASTADLGRYSLTLRNHTRLPFSIGGATLRPSSSAVLPLSHGDAITLQTKCSPERGTL